MPINIPPGEGWWLKARTGEAVKIAEHWEAVQADPKKYGVADLPARVLTGDREETLTEVLRKGWIRVRTHRGETVFEAWQLTRKVADAIAEHVLDVIQPGILSTLRINVVEKNRSFTVRAADIYETLEKEVNPASKNAAAWKVEHLGNQLYLIGRAVAGK